MCSCMRIKRASLHIHLKILYWCKSNEKPRLSFFLKLVYNFFSHVCFASDLKEMRCSYLVVYIRCLLVSIGWESLWMENTLFQITSRHMWNQCKASQITAAFGQGQRWEIIQCLGSYSSDEHSVLVLRTWNISFYLLAVPAVLEE